MCLVFYLPRLLVQLDIQNVLLYNLLYLIPSLYIYMLVLKCVVSLLHTLQINFIYLRFNLNVSENKIKDFEKILRQQRKVQDMADEIDSLKIEKERNEKDLAR